MKKVILFCKILPIYLILLSLLGCSSSALIGWNNTNNNKFGWDGDEDSLIVYNWNGAYFDKVINGKGTLTTYKDDNTTETKQITAIYGATDASLVTHLRDGSLYLWPPRRRGTTDKNVD